MSVQKYNSKTRINNETIPYTQVNTNVIQNIDDMEAGFVWVYLQSKPETWDVIKAHIKNKFKMGNSKLKRIFSTLQKHNLIRNHIVRTEDGRRISHHDIEVLNGQDFIKDPNLSTQLSTGSEINPVENQPASEWPTINKRKNIKERNKREPARKKRVPLPPDFVFEERVIQVCHEVSKKVGLLPHELLNKFKLTVKDRAMESADWNASFEKFLITERPSVKNEINQRQEMRSTVPWFKAEHANIN